MDTPTEADLVHLSIAGNTQAFATLIRRHEQSIAALIRAWVYEPHEAEDVLQETLISAWQGLPRLRDPERVRPWLLQIARNRCRDHARSTNMPETVAEPTQIEQLVNRYGRSEGQVTHRLEEALEEASEPDRTLLNLFYLEGFTIKEIANRTQAPTGSVKRRLYTARHHLRRILEEDE